LPISVVTLNLVMMSTTATLWIVTALLMAAAHVIAPSRFDKIPILPVFITIIAVAALAQCVLLSNKRTNPFIPRGVFLASRLVPHAIWDAIPSPSQEQVILISLAGIVVAAILNHRILTRSNTAYTRRTALPSTFGVTQTR
jgi:hypothetical protein